MDFLVRVCSKIRDLALWLPLRAGLDLEAAKAGPKSLQWWYRNAWCLVVGMVLGAVMLPFDFMVRVGLAGVVAGVVLLVKDFAPKAPVSKKAPLPVMPHTTLAVCAVSCALGMLLALSKFALVVDLVKAVF